MGQKVPGPTRRYSPPPKISKKLSHFKGYLHYKMITSQNVSSEVQVKNFFISQESYFPFSRYSSFCIFNHSMIYQ